MECIMRNMKYQLLCIAMLAASCLLTACGSGTKEITGEVAYLDQSRALESEEAKEDGDETEESANTAVVTATGDGYYFTYGDVEIEMDANAAPIVEALGEPASYYEATSCAFDGLDKMYTYAGFELDTYPVGEEDYVSAVLLKDDSVATSEGIAIGSSKEDVEAAYGASDLTGDGTIVYEKGDMKLNIIVKDDMVISIEYKSTALEE